MGEELPKVMILPQEATYPAATQGRYFQMDVNYSSAVKSETWCFKNSAAPAAATKKLG